MDNKIKSIIEATIAQIENEANIAIERKKCEYRETQVRPAIEELNANYNKVVAELNEKLAIERKNIQDMSDFRATNEVKAEYAEALNKLRAALPKEAK